MSCQQVPLTVWQWAVTETDSAFSLPGTDELLSFAGLWADPSSSHPPESDNFPEMSGGTAPRTIFPENSSETQFHTPGLLPEPVGDSVSLFCPLPSAETDSRYLLSVPSLLGKGTLSLNNSHLLSFCSYPGFRTDTEIGSGTKIDLTDLLKSDQTNLLQLSFESFRPAGICGLFSLRMFSDAQIELTAASRTNLNALCTFQVSAYTTSRYVLRIESLSDGTIFEEKTLSISEDATERVTCTFPLTSKKIYYYRISLLRTGRNQRILTLCDTLTIPVGPAPRPGNAILPVPPEDSILYTPDFIQLLRRIGSPSVYTTVPLSESWIAKLTEAGIPLCLPLPEQDTFPPTFFINPGICFISPPVSISLGAASVWQFCGLLAQPRPLPPDSLPEELLGELFGSCNYKKIDSLPACLAELHLLHVRLHAELVRQGIGSGTLCSAGEWDDPKVLDTLSTVFQPCHLSIAPLQGAWFANTDLIISCRVFLEDKHITQMDNSCLRVELCLVEPKNESSSYSYNILYKEYFTVSRMIQTNLTQKIHLPDRTSYLVLCGRLLEGCSVKEIVMIPVFVGTYAVLEAALTLSSPSSQLDLDVIV